MGNEDKKPKSLRRERAAAPKKDPALKGAYNIKKTGVGVQLNEMSSKLASYNQNVFLLGMFGLILQVAVVEMQHRSGDEPTDAGTMIKLVITLSTFIAVGLEALRIQLLFKRDKMTNKLLKGDTYITSGYLRDFLVTAILLLIHAPPSVAFHLSASALAVDDARHGWSRIEYTSDEFLVAIMLVRFLWLIRVAKDKIGMGSDTARACAMMYEEVLDTRFFFKFVVKLYPVTLVVTLFFWIVVVFGYLVSVCERKVDAEFEKLSTALWLIVQTVTTVGYGDVTPHTNPGRLITGLLCFVSIFFVAMAISAVMLHFQMTNKELKVSSLLQHSRGQADLKLSAAKVISTAWKTYLEYEPAGKNIEQSEGLAKKIRTFRQKRKALSAGVDEGEQLLFKEILNTRAVSEQMMDDMAARLERIEKNTQELNEKMEGQVRDIAEGIRQTVKMLRPLA